MTCGEVRPQAVRGKRDSAHDPGIRFTACEALVVPCPFNNRELPKTTIMALPILFFGCVMRVLERGFAALEQLSLAR